MCFASLILCIKSVLRDLKPCTVRAQSNVSAFLTSEGVET